MAGFGAKLGQQIGRYFEALAPMSGKHARGALGLSSPELMKEGGVYWNTLKNHWKAMKSPPGIPDMARQYFRGANAEDILYAAAGEEGRQGLLTAGLVTSSKEEMKRRQLLRIGTAAGAGVIAANAIFGSEENLVGRATGFAARVGMHGGIGWGMHHLGRPGLAKGYWAWAGINMLRGGDNFGPF